VEFITAEDEQDEVHRRLVDIAKSAGRSLRDFNGLHISSLADRDAVLAALEGSGGARKLVETDLYRGIDCLLARAKPALLVLDTLADIYGGDEIVRQQVRAFVNMLRRLALAHDVAIVVLAHPSLSGLNSGNGTSGSTAWNNSVRFRAYFTREDGDGAD